MGTASTTTTFWSFIHYVTHNPFKSPSGMTADDIVDMAKKFAAENVTEITTGTDEVAVDGIYTDIEWPDKTGTGGTIQAYRSTATIDQAYYPEKHKGS